MKQEMIVAVASTDHLHFGPSR